MKIKEKLKIGKKSWKNVLFKIFTWILQIILICSFIYSITLFVGVYVIARLTYVMVLVYQGSMWWGAFVSLAFMVLVGALLTMRSFEFLWRKLHGWFSGLRRQMSAKYIVEDEPQEKAKEITKGEKDEHQEV